jgi:hypothetical protein
MAKIPGGFDASAVEPQANISEPIPAGVYEVEITGADVKETSKKNGTGLNVEYTVIGPTHANRKMWQFLNLQHENSQAEQIGQAQLSALCRAVGISKLDDSDDLFGKVLRVQVTIRPEKNGYKASNDVRGWEAVGTALPARTAPPPAAQKPAGKANPWARA